MWIIFNSLYRRSCLLSVSIHPHLDLKVTNCMNLQFAPADKVVMKDGNQCQKLSQFTGVHFLNLNPNSYDINNMKLNLSISTIVKFIANDQGLSFKDQSYNIFIIKVLLCVF